MNACIGIHVCYVNFIGVGLAEAVQDLEVDYPHVRIFAMHNSTFMWDLQLAVNDSQCVTIVDPNSIFYDEVWVQMLATSVVVYNLKPCA